MKIEPSRTITIYGASDDLIEVEGDIHEEFSFSGDKGYILTSDGTVVRVIYDGDWLLRVAYVGTAVYEHKGLGADSDHPSYTETITLTGQIAWVACSDEKPIFANGTAHGE